MMSTNYHLNCIKAVILTWPKTSPYRKALEMLLLGWYRKSGSNKAQKQHVKPFLPSTNRNGKCIPFPQPKVIMASKPQFEDKTYEVVCIPPPQQNNVGEKVSRNVISLHSTHKMHFSYSDDQGACKDAGIKNDWELSEVPIAKSHDVECNRNLVTAVSNRKKKRSKPEVQHEYLVFDSPSMSNSHSCNNKKVSYNVDKGVPSDAGINGHCKVSDIGISGSHKDVCEEGWTTVQSKSKKKINQADVHQLLVKSVSTNEDQNYNYWTCPLCVCKNEIIKNRCHRCYYLKAGSTNDDKNKLVKSVSTNEDSNSNIWTKLDNLIKRQLQL